MTKLIFVFALITILNTLCGAAGAQQPSKIPRVVFVGSANNPNRDSFREALRELGYVEGRNIVIDFSPPQGRTDQWSELMAELVRAKVELIVTTVTLAAQAAKKLTTTIPIVIVGTGDPLGTGLVASLARPGGNVTGLSGLAPELSGKRLDLLKEAFPKISRIAVFWNPTSPSNAISWKETQTAAQTMGVQLQSLEVRSIGDFEVKFRTATKDHAEAIVVIRDNLMNESRREIIAFAAKSRLPAMYPAREYVEDGGLISYAPDFSALYRRAAFYVDKILKGTKPADLPVEQPTKFEFVVNLKTAKQIGLTIPQSVLYRADRVIK
jgi:putative ABC transport system substrate-binding protein